MNLAVYKNTNDADTIEAFKNELFKDFGLQETPETMDIFTRAWHYGHEGGFEEVYWHFYDLIEVFEVLHEHQKKV